MRIAVYGSGGVGGYFGGRLAQSGQDVTFIARGEHLTALQSGGMKVSSIAADFALSRVKASDKPTTVGVVDYVICAVKAWQVAAAAKAMQPLIGPDTLVIPLQNGVEAPAQLAAVLGGDTVLGGLCAIIAFRAEPGHIKHIGANPLIRFGHIDGRADQRVNKLEEIFNRCHGVKASIPEDITVAMWRKFMLICAWSGLASVARAPVGILLKQGETRQLLVDAMQEIYTLALSRNINMPADSVHKTIEMLESFPANSTTSMQRDITQGRPSELDAHHGAVVRLAQDSGIDTPVNRFILYSLRSQELRARGALSF